MSKKHSLVFVLFLLTHMAGASHFTRDFRQVVLRRNTTAIDSFFTVCRKGPGFSATWIYSRTLAGSFKEQSCKIVYSVPDSASRGSSIFTCYLRFVSSGTAIASCQLLEEKSRIVNRLLSPYTIPLEVYETDSLMLRFKKTFESEYLVPPDTGELFNDTLAFGSKCGPNGEDPYAKKQIDRLITGRDMAALRKWICSVCTEKQLYGLYAYAQLRKQGYVPTPDENLVLQRIGQKKGTVMGCNGGITSVTRIDMARARIRNM